MTRAPTPNDLWRVGYSYWRMMTEAQAVVAMRLWGMAGLWRVDPGENRRMVAEKPGAFLASGLAAARATAAGKRPDQIAAAAVRPLRRKTGANSRRLAQRGPRLPG